MRNGWSGAAASVLIAGALAAAAARPKAQAPQGQAAPAAASPGQAGADPRVGLKGGLQDAGQAALNMQLIVNVPRPRGFFNPDAPFGYPTPPEKEPDPNAPKEAPKAKEAPPSAEEKKIVASLDFANSDMAFQATHLFLGNFNGFNVYDIANPQQPKLVTSVVCPGGQGDMSVAGHLLIMSVEQTRGRLDCGTGGVNAPVSAARFRGVRVFDISDIRKPKQVAAVQTCRGSHTHTLVTVPADPDNLYVYGSGTSSVRSAEELAGCSGAEPTEDPNTALFSIDVIQIPIANPSQAKIVNRPRIFADPASGKLGGLWPGGDHGPGTQKTSATNQCHDITVFPEIGLAGGACAGNGILLDISDPVHPRRLDDASDKNFAYWHSATFNNDGSKVLFTDEWGGGIRARCRASDQPNWGADAIFRIVDRKLQFESYYKIPAAQTEQENCVAHNGSLIPVPGRDIMVQAWYQGGVSVFDFTDAAHPVEIAYFDRGPVDPRHLVTAGEWSAYYYNGYIYGSEIARGLDVFRLTPSEHLTQNEIDAAALVRLEEFNPQDQKKVSWPASPVVGRAYLDQLTRSGVLDASRVSAITAALAAFEGGKPAGPATHELVAELTAVAGSASERDAERLQALAAILQTAAGTRH